MPTPDPETDRIKQLTELHRELYILETGSANVLVPAIDFSSYGDHLKRIFELKSQIEELERSLST